jgi:hypothetical protein
MYGFRPRLMGRRGSHSGDFDHAVEWQQKGREFIPKEDQAARAAYASRLSLYRKQKPYHEEPRSPKSPPSTDASHVRRLSCGGNLRVER